MPVNKNKVYELYLLKLNTKQVLLNSECSCSHTADACGH